MTPTEQLELMVKYFPEKPLTIIFEKGEFTISTNGGRIHANTIAECINIFMNMHAEMYLTNAIAEFNKQEYTYEKLKA